MIFSCLFLFSIRSIYTRIGNFGCGLFLFIGGYFLGGFYWEMKYRIFEGGVLFRGDSSVKVLGLERVWYF